MSWSSVNELWSFFWSKYSTDQPSSFHLLLSGAVLQDVLSADEEEGAEEPFKNWRSLLTKQRFDQRNKSHPDCVRRFSCCVFPGEKGHNFRNMVTLLSMWHSQEIRKSQTLDLYVWQQLDTIIITKIIRIIIKYTWNKHFMKRNILINIINKNKEVNIFSFRTRSSNEALDDQWESTVYKNQCFYI